MPNADNAKEWVEQLAELWRKRRTFKGAIGLGVILNAFLTFISPIAYFVLSKCGVVETAHHHAVFFAVVAFVYGASNLVFIVVWTSWRMLPMAGSDNVEILFAPVADDDCDDLVYSLYDRLIAEVATRGLAQAIKCRHLPERYVIRTAEEAHNCLMRTGARLLIYGSLARGRIRGDSIEGFKSISFTVRHRALAPNQEVPLLKDLAAGLAFRAFTAKEENSFIDKDVVMNNIGEVAVFFVGLALLTDGRIEQAAPMLEGLQSDVKQRQVAKVEPHRQAFEQAIATYLTVIYQAQFTDVYNRDVIAHITDHSHDHDVARCSAVLDKLLALNKGLFSFHLGKAIMLFHGGDVDGALMEAEKAKRLAPFAHAAPYLSTAFLYLWKRDYRRSFMEYMRAGKCAEWNVETVMSVLVFLNTILRHHPERTDLRFAMAFVNDKFLDQSLARDDYEAFLAGADEVVSPDFVKFARRRLEAISP
jgi:tetratricopeptide (TPR) repeat protein